MKAFRIYGSHNGKPFCKFPHGAHKMDTIKLDVYVKKKKIQTFYGKDFIHDSEKRWRFTIGDVTCFIHEKKPFKFRVTCENSDIFDNNQVAGVFYMHTLVESKMSPKRHLEKLTDDEMCHLIDYKDPPFRDMDSHLLSLLDSPSFKSPTTGQCTRNREILAALLNPKYKMELYEVRARNRSIITHCNSWRNRFGDEKLFEYMMTSHFFEKLMDAMDHYFFAGVLKKIADWGFDSKVDVKTGGKTIVNIEIMKDNIRAKRPRDFIRMFQQELAIVVFALLSPSREELTTNTDDVECIINNIFGLGPINPNEPRVFNVKFKSVPTAEYQILYHGDKPGLFLL